MLSKQESDKIHHTLIKLYPYYTSISVSKIKTIIIFELINFVDGPQIINTLAQTTQKR